MNDGRLVVVELIDTTRNIKADEKTKIPREIFFLDGTDGGERAEEVDL